MPQDMDGVTIIASCFYFFVTLVVKYAEDISYRFHKIRLIIHVNFLPYFLGKNKK